ncbi:Basal-body rod modification protein FlgD [Luteimonas sp. 9C]|uniref:flagellar hook assembly protein FlgD n=1 Tax=Luteimonas sp. 9C TaxID=2653148 RepID=UPI0012F347C0|nr:flagellar hook capping FlgD N-terminal domain-containing protein [Luteimonas sp. 9C]VXC06790.1 Basal-body rod modification protein FlgD [Luteimonas sp. 9C]
MAAINTDTLASLGLGPKQTPAEKSTGALGQANFLLLMTEQLKNQDPLKPLDSQQFLGQLAQFSTVQGIDQMQTAMGSMASVMESDQTLRAASLVGHDALVETSKVQLAAGAPLSGEIQATRAGAQTIEIVDAGGTPVRRMVVQAPGAGATAFDWDGLTDAGAPAPGGPYTIRAVAGSAADGAGTGEALSVRVKAKVESVSIETSGLTLNMAGIGSQSLAAVRRIG